MISELQQLVEALAAALDRPVVLEDRRQRLIAYSQHDQPMDGVRRETILQRQTTPEVIAELRRFGIATSQVPVRIPGNPRLDLLPRVCVPLRHAEVLLGYLWFLDENGSMPDEDLERAVRRGGDFALALYRENLLGELSRRREEEALRNLLLTEVEARREAARILRDLGVFAGDGAVVALVAQPVRDDGEAPNPELQRLAIEQALVATRRQAGPHDALHLVRHDHGLLIVTVGAAGTRPPVVTHGQALVHALQRALVGLPGSGRVVVGVGEARPRLELVVESYEQARLAARLAVSLPGVGPLAEWRELGVYRALAQLSTEQLGAGLLHAGLEALLAAGEDQQLARTLETYLDLAGNVGATAAALQLHRTSLYHRLRRIEQVADADLADGNDRLALHLGLKLARLTGRYAP